MKLSMVLRITLAATASVTALATAGGSAMADSLTATPEKTSDVVKSGVLFPGGWGAINDVKCPTALPYPKGMTITDGGRMDTFSWYVGPLKNSPSQMDIFVATPASSPSIPYEIRLTCSNVPSSPGKVRFVQNNRVPVGGSMQLGSLCSGYYTNPAYVSSQYDSAEVSTGSVEIVKPASVWSTRQTFTNTGASDQPVTFVSECSK